MGKPEKTTQEKQLAMMRIQTLLLVCILVLLVISAVFLIGQFSRLTATVSQLDLDQVNRLVEELSDVANQLSAMDGAALNETVRSLQKAADNLTAVDMNSLNEAVNALSGAGSGHSAVIGGDRNRAQGEEHNERKDQRKVLLHGFSSISYFSGIFPDFAGILSKNGVEWKFMLFILTIP